MTASAPAQVTVVTPTLHAERFLRETIESVLGQTYMPINYIIVDGGSSDDTAAIASSLESRVTFVEAHGLNQAEAINLGFRQTVSKYFTFLNADDTLYPRAIESAVAALEASPGAPFVYADGLHVDAAGQPAGIYPSHSFSRARLSRECFICQPATLIRSAAFAAAGGLDETLETAFDYDLWIRLTHDGAIPVHVAEFWATSRMHESNKSLGRRETVYREAFRVLRKHYGYVPFNWVHAYAGYIVEGKDYFYDAPSGSIARTLLTLRTGLRENQRWLRFISEFFSETLRLSRAS